MQFLVVFHDDFWKYKQRYIHSRSFHEQKLAEKINIILFHKLVSFHDSRNLNYFFI
jgi:hypothetical protein